MYSRFRIRPEHCDDMLNLLAENGVTPLRIYDREDGAVAVEIGDITVEQGQALASGFRAEWSAIVAFGGVNPFEFKD